ncbi:MAG: hypothetical protein ACHQF2_02205 [Flavobacteriales bacterium]
MNLKTWFLVCSKLLLACNLASACCFYPMGEDIRVSFFAPLGKIYPWFESVGFTTDVVNDGENKKGLEFDRLKNCREWQTHCGKSINIKDIYYVIYEMPAIELQWTMQKPSNNFTGNTFLKFLGTPAGAAYLEYLNYAKSTENWLNPIEDPWTEDMNEDRSLLEDYKDRFDKSFTNNTNPWLKKRFAFLFLRTASTYAHDPCADDSIINYLVRNSDTSIIDYWGAYYMGWMKRTGYEANLGYAGSITGSAEKLFPSVNWFDSKSIMASVYHAKTPRLRSNLWALYALNRPRYAITWIENCFKEDPSNPLLMLLIAREINKCEDWLITKPVSGYEPATRDFFYDPYAYEDNKERNDSLRLKHKKYAWEVQSLLYRIMQHTENRKNSFWPLAAAHLATIRENYLLAHRFLNEYNRNKVPAFQLQVKMTRFLLACSEGKKMDTKWEKEFFVLLDSVEKYPSLEKYKLRNRLITLAATTYRISGKVFKASLLQAHLRPGYFQDYEEDPFFEVNFSDWISYLVRHGNTRDADSLVRLIHKSSYNTFEKRLLQPYIFNKNALASLKEWTGSLYLRDGQYEKAESILSEVENDHWDVTNNENRYNYNYYLNQNMFYAHSGNNHRNNECDTIMYNKYTFCLRALELKRLARANNGYVSEQARLGLAHAIYNMTIHGNAWIIYSNDGSEYYMSDWIERGNEFYGCTKAFKAYQAVFNSATNIEIKAACCMMMAECKINEYNHGSQNSVFAIKYATEYLHTFMSQYNKSATYHRAISSCSGPEEYRKWAMYSGGDYD